MRWAWPFAADACLQLEKLDEVEELLHWLDGHPAGHIPAVLHAERRRVNARLMAARGAPDTDAAFDIALQDFRKLGSPYHLAVALLDVAGFIAGAGDSEGVSHQAAEAHRIAQKLGAQGLMSRAAQFDQLVGSALP